ncbi:hypothetical protein [Sorangium sp. So ce1000]|uniref:hypothetical protein n=1 Tax=Sorangium sp. So ce1000 TaxID=3133325 RepID=UPI003F5EE87C
MNLIGKHFAAMFILCATAAPTIVACGSVDGSDGSDPESAELVGEAADEVFSCGWSAVDADATKSTFHWTAQSFGDTYSPGLCPRFVVEFTQKDQLTVGWNDSILTQTDCQRMHLVYTGYTYSGGTWVNKGTFHGHGVGGSSFCGIEADTGYSHPDFGSGTKYRVAVAAYEESCTDTCYYDFKRVAVESAPPPL